MLDKCYVYGTGLIFQPINPIEKQMRLMYPTNTGPADQFLITRSISEGSKVLRKLPENVSEGNSALLANTSLPYPALCLPTFSKSTPELYCSVSFPYGSLPLTAISKDHKI